MAFFEGLIETEDGAPVAVAYVGGVAHYVIDDQGFKRHVEAAAVDRVVLAQFMQQLQENRAEATALMMRMMGQEDLFTKAMLDSTIRNIDLDQMLGQRLPPDARQWLALLGFRIVVDIHGEVVRVDMPAASADGFGGGPAGWDED
ncbi:MAG: hypothetical protein BWY52_02739 [Chloroflexi bacterium ADurb.Bin325]|nr:MAG: hypothetical protein BWY52_02739 [Chloroflexi bacterium ADurb.Bin325]